MNWTGGRLSRHSRNAKGSITAKQKEHFAKVRSAQQASAPKISPAKWSVFNQIASASRDQPEAEASERSRRVRNASEAIEAGIDGRAGDSEGQKERDKKRPQTSARDLSRDVTYSPHARRLDSEELRMVKREPGQADELNDASLYSKPQLKPKHDAETTQPDKVLPHQNLLEKRKKMLSKVDWVGVTLQNPPDLKYTPPEKSDQIAKRRKVSGSHRARYEPRRREIPPVPAAHLPQKDLHEAKPRGADVRISIGGKELRVGVSSSSGIGKAPLDSVKKADGTASSDIMLLDCEEADVQTPPGKHDYHTDTRPPPLIQSRRNSFIDANPPGSQGSSNFMLLTEPLETPPIANGLPLPDPKIGGERLPSLSSRSSYVRGSAGLRNPSSNHSGRTLNTSEIRELYYNFRDQPDHAVAPEAAFKGQKRVMEQVSPNMQAQQTRVGLDELMHISEQHSPAPSSDRFTLLSFGDGHKTTRYPDHRYVEPEVASRPSASELGRSLSPPLQRPDSTYQSFYTSQIMPSNTSNAELSMIVQTGKAESASRQVENLDEEVWRSWVLPEDDSLDKTEIEETSESYQVALAAGINMYDAHSKEAPRSEYVDAEEILENSSEVRQSIEEDIDDAGDITDNDDSALQLHNELESYLYPDFTRSRANSEEQEETNENATKPVPAVAPDSYNSKDKLDENALWQKFVFTSDSDDEDSTAEWQADFRKPSMVPRERSEDSSLLAHPSTETEEPPQKPAVVSGVSASKPGYRSFSELQQLMTEIPSSNLDTDERFSQRATQATPAKLSPTVVGRHDEEPYDGQTTHATQGSYRSSPDILSTGSPLLGSRSRNSTGSKNGTNRYTPSDPKRKVVFTKPKPFIGKGSTASRSNYVQKPLRIGGKFVVKDGTKGNGGVGNIRGVRESGEKKRNNYDLQRDVDEVESIEDY